MIVNFIGQGIESLDKESVGGYICSSLKDERFNKCIFISAFASSSGLEIVKPFIEIATQANKSIVFYIGVDDKGTSKEALDFLITNKCETYIFHTCSNFIFHPKVYLFQGEHNRIIVGSSNLTKSGLFHNIEASLLLDFSNDDSAGKKVLKQINDSFQNIFEQNDINLNVLNAELLDLLTKQRLIYLEGENSFDNENYSKDDKKEIADLFPERDKNQINVIDLGNIEVNENKRYERNRDDLVISSGYLAKWDFMFGKMIAFKQKYNSVVVKNDYRDKALYGWYLKQKILYSHDLIPTEHKDKLNSIDFYWGDAHKILWNAKWEESYTELLTYKDNVDFPNLKRTKDNSHPMFAISNWIAVQRGKYKEKKLNEYQIEKLESIGLIWEMIRNNGTRIKDDDNWFDSLTKLQDYKIKYGNCNVSQTNKNPDLKKLGKWINDQRTNKKRNILDKHRIDLLDDIGFIWNMDLYNFELTINALSDYKKIFGNFNIPVDYPSNPNLGWNVYRLKTQGVKEEWKANRLLEIGFDLLNTQNINEQKSYITKAWFIKLNELKALHLEGIDTNLPKDFNRNPTLGTWVYNQKRAFRYDKLKDQQIDELKKLGVILSKEAPLEKTWNEMYLYLQLYIEEFGNIVVPKSYDITLYYWIGTQRTNKKLGIITQDKFDKLNEIGFDWKERKIENRTANISYPQVRQ